MKLFLRRALLLLAGITLASACGFNDSLREYLYSQFWMPFTKRPHEFRRLNRPDSPTPYAGMTAVVTADTPLNKLRAAYKMYYQPGDPIDRKSLQPLLAAARSDPKLSSRDREEVALVDAKFALRAEAFAEAQQKLTDFLRQAKHPAFRSEARGWIAHLHYRNGNQSAAGKIYLDELNRPTPSSAAKPSKTLSALPTAKTAVPNSSASSKTTSIRRSTPLSQSTWLPIP